MQITTFTPDDIHPFLSMAKDEGWISHRRELAFLLERSPEGCLVCREQGRPVGFVTAVRYGRSGWIGNLLVGAANRGRGIGSSLFRQAMEVLNRSNVTTVWLTASTAGRPIYERSGFRGCDRIRRWERTGGPAKDADRPSIVRNDWQEIDYLGWGDARDELLAYAAADGGAIGTTDGFLMLQRLGNGHQIGPFGALNAAVAEKLLEQALARGSRLLLDVPAANRAAGKLLLPRGFEVIGEVELMYAGRPAAYHPECIYGLASMGSMG